jgi:hypothetical protein
LIINGFDATFNRQDSWSYTFDSDITSISYETVGFNDTYLIDIFKFSVENNILSLSLGKGDYTPMVGRIIIHFKTEIPIEQDELWLYVNLI